MEENNNLKFNIEVPYNHEIIVAERKKTNITIGVVLLISSLAFIAFTIFSLLSNNSSIWVPIMFGAFALLTIGYAIIQFVSIKPKAKNELKFITYNFYEGFLHVAEEDRKENGKTKEITNCLYRPYKSKQYVSKAIESEQKFQIKILTGTYNFAPQYKVLSIPKAVFKNNEELDAFKNFLKETLEKDYIGG